MAPKLKEISDQWLSDKSAGEKGFSLGYFDEEYLRNFDIAVVEQSGEPIAFANLWRSAELAELSIDLMRYRADAPHGVMEYLLWNLFVWSRTRVCMVRSRNGSAVGHRHASTRTRLESHIERDLSSRGAVL